MPNDYSKRLKDPRWQRKRLEILQRDNWTCRDTGATDEPLNVHHCWYAKGGPWETPSEYLLTVTEDAHKRRQELEGRAKKALGLIMANLDRWSLDDFVDQVESIASDRSKLESLSDGISIQPTTEWEYDAEVRWYIKLTNKFPDGLGLDIFKKVLGR